MLFVGAGLLLGPAALGVLEVELGDESLKLLTELTLAMLLFSDASRIDIVALREEIKLPARLLGIGLPITIAMGTVITSLLLTDLSLAEAALVAAILAPTDAALGQAVVSDKRVPVRIRQTLNVESGLNDGLVVPVIAVLLAVSLGDEIESGASLLGEAATEVGLGVLVGVAVGSTLGVVAGRAHRSGFADSESLRLVIAGGAIGTFALASVIGGNGFIAAFVCGLALGTFRRERLAHHGDFAEDLGQLGASASFVLFGALLAWPALEVLTVAVAVCGLLTLTLGRMIPVAISLTGSGLRAPTVAFLGWFGPRGLASMLFGLLIVVEKGEAAGQLQSIVSFVVLCSVVLHGLSAAPGAARYAAWFNANKDQTMEEANHATEHRIRWRPHLPHLPRHERSGDNAG